ncbi:50S ribosomal protein L15 [Candidatus Kaiserbacteria bacterium CG_4_9_14_0_2_um_filter_41_32]|uniref:Large ribosomal subunit protein uL15 n=1 Tax=Candidatus Kaiserbacteria bacterium CG_4_9_14_0_2_um_filter_41_32 TaxID=1974601 RepID=A0A2M8FEA2_9BACT|nr:MAG: 50S ribosomal protein L15 [Candidatus Kaiserbacteria bacterium CG_4_9_14_0_2_um_filter_41_32]
MQLHELVPATKAKTAKRIGRGGKRGKTSGRGGKGQTARTGNSMRPEMRDIIKKLPKLRGHGKNRARTVNEERVVAVPVNVSVIEARFEAGATVSPKTLVAMGIITAIRKRVPVVKILGTGDLTKKVKVEGCTVSKTAQAKIEKAGGSVAK